MIAIDTSYEGSVAFTSRLSGTRRIIGRGHYFSMRLR